MAESPIIELRIYRVRPGARDRFVALFDSKARPAQEAMGIRVLGQFVSLDDEQLFVWLRAFPSEEARRVLTEAFYDDPVWTDELALQALPLLEDYSDVRLLSPTPGSTVR